MSQINLTSNFKRVNTKSTLILAVANNWYSVVETLLRTGSNVHVESESALNYAVKGNNLEMIKLLIKHGADPNKLHPDTKNYYIHHYSKEINEVNGVNGINEKPVEKKLDGVNNPKPNPYFSSYSNFNPAGAKSRPTALPGFQKLDPKPKPKPAPIPQKKMPTSFQAKTLLSRPKVPLNPNKK